MVDYWLMRLKIGRQRDVESLSLFGQKGSEERSGWPGCPYAIFFANCRLESHFEAKLKGWRTAMQCSEGALHHDSGSKIAEHVDKWSHELHKSSWHSGLLTLFQNHGEERVCDGSWGARPPQVSALSEPCSWSRLNTCRSQRHC